METQVHSILWVQCGLHKTYYDFNLKFEGIYMKSKCEHKYENKNNILREVLFVELSLVRFMMLKNTLWYPINDQDKCQRL